MIDLHTHVLPGVDDGCRTIEESVELARTAAAEGITALAATPHVRSDYPTEPGTMERLVAQVRAAVAAAGLAVEILPGGEIAVEMLDGLGLDGAARFGLGGNPRVVLVEVPYVGWPLLLESWVFRMQAAAVVPVLAHPERNNEVQARPDLLGTLVEAGALVQLTAASVDGRLGSKTRRTAAMLLERGFAHLISSDAHTPGVRAAGLARAAAAVGDPELARWLTDDVPRALVTREPLPQRPLRRGRRLRLGR
jgi:protein-tyrosine phosphatase